MSGYDYIKIFWIAYLAVLGSEGYSIYDRAYYPCPVYDNNVGICLCINIFNFTCHQKVRIWEHFAKYRTKIPKHYIIIFRYDSAIYKSSITSMYYDIHTSHHNDSMSCIWRYNFRIWHYFVKITSSIFGIYHNSSTICQDVVLQSMWDCVVICYVDPVNPK